MDWEIIRWTAIVVGAIGLAKLCLGALIDCRPAPIPALVDNEELERRKRERARRTHEYESMLEALCDGRSTDAWMEVLPKGVMKSLAGMRVMYERIDEGKFLIGVITDDHSPMRFLIQHS